MMVASLIGSPAALGQPGTDASSRGGQSAEPAASGSVAAAPARAVTTSRVAGPDRSDGRDADQDLARTAMARGDVVPLDRVLKKATDFVPGDVLEVKLKSRPDLAWVYEIRMLSGDGRIRLVVVDAARNTVLEVRRP